MPTLASTEFLLKERFVVSGTELITVEVDRCGQSKRGETEGPSERFVSFEGFPISPYRNVGRKGKTVLLEFSSL
jgi:hypothetical protein